MLKEHYLDPRTAHIHLSNVLTADRVHLELELKVFYRVHPRNTAPANLTQVLNMPDAGLESIVRRALSSRIAERVRGFGIDINPQFGVAVMNMQPNEIYQRALQEESAATSQGNAVLKRVTPTLQNMGQQQALQVLYTHLASTITKANNVTDHIYNIQNGHEVPIQDQDINPMIENVPQGSHHPPSKPPSKPKTERQYPIAAD